jgi:hypothetical protein
MPHGSYSLGEAATKLNMIRLKCCKCGRAGQYRIDQLIEQYGLTGLRTLGLVIYAGLGRG